MDITNQVKSRSVGRPCKQIDARKQILHATKMLCLSKSKAEITTRLISERSGFNVSLIRYYFGNKEGLIHAMLMDQLKEFSTRLQCVLNEDITSFPGYVIQSCFLEASKNIETISLIVKLTGHTLSDEKKSEADKNINDYFYYSIQKVIKHDLYFLSDEDHNIDCQMSTFINLLLSPLVNNSIDIKSPTVKEQQKINYEILNLIIKEKRL